MKLSGKKQITDARTCTYPLFFLHTVNLRQVFCLVLLAVLAGCVTEPQKSVDDYVLPALSGWDGSSQNPQSPKPETGHEPKPRPALITQDRNLSPAHKPREKENPDADLSLPGNRDREAADAASGKSREKTAQQESGDAHQKSGKSLPSQKMTIRFHNEDLGLVLQAMARARGLSIMLSENVKGKVTVDIQNQPWDQIFSGILRTHALIYEWEGDIIRVMTVDDMGRDLRELEMRQKQEEQKRNIETVAPFATAVLRIDYADAENLKQIFEKFLAEGSNVRRGSVMVDKYSNSIIVQAREKEIGQMRLLVEKLDRPTLQIRIEVQIVEANSDTARELGIEWGGYYSASIGGTRKLWVTPGIDSAAAGGQTTTSGTVSGTTGTNTGTNTGSSSSMLMQNLPSTLAEGSGLLLGMFAGDAGKYLLGLQLSALEKQGKVRILSNPSISTIDNHTALIESGMEVPYQTVDDDEVNIEFKRAVLSLEVTPHIIDGNFLKMKILTSKDELDFGSGLEGNPRVLTKKASTSVILQDGQTMVIGGLRKEKTSTGESGVPLLKKIPLLGGLFRKEYRSNDMEELLIFITPRIVK